MSTNIIKTSKQDYVRLSAIWESAVKATHDFLDSRDFAYYRSRLTHYFGQVALYAYKDEQGELAGFMGVSGPVLEMLFVDVAFRGNGIGTKLLRHAVHQLNVRKLDVNEQNIQAVCFYTRRGFRITGRSPFDCEGKPYPLLHLQYDHAHITCVPVNKKQYLDLLLLGDEQESMIDRYLERGEMFVLEDNGVKAVCVVTDEGGGTCELKNIAVVPHAQRQGYGSRLIRLLINHYSGRYDRMLVGTGDVPSTVGFYRHCGFVYSHRIGNFFIDNYDHPIVEDGIRLKDMVYLKYDMKSDFTIRQARQSDVVELKELFQTTVLAVNRRDYSQEEVEDWASCGNDLAHMAEMIRTHYFFVAVDDNSRIVGFSSITPQGYLHSMFVHKDFQGKGIATMLLAEAERYAAFNGITRITSEVSLTARPFFEKKGYVVEMEQKRRANRLSLTNFWMAKTIKGASSATALAAPISFSLFPGITLREVRMEDAATIFRAIDTHRDYLRTWLPFVDAMCSVADEETFLRSMLDVPADKYDPIFGVVNEQEEICGLIGFHFSDRANHRTEIGYWLLPEYQHQGIVTEGVRRLCRWAVKERDIRRIQIRCAVGNEASNRVPLRLGFQYEGTERAGELLASGEYADINVYSILKEEVALE